jgi:uncharacterized membrane protein
MAGRWNDERIENVVGNLLRSGVVLAGLVVLVGAVVFLARHGEARPHYAIFRGEPSGEGRGIIQLGLLLLIATPVARVLFSVAGFLLEGDRLYVVITLIVFAVLVFSLAGGHL